MAQVSTPAAAASSSTPRLTASARKELGRITGVLKNAQKTALQKHNMLDGLHPDISKNQLVGTDAANARSKKATLSDVVRPTEPPPPQAEPASVPFKVVMHQNPEAEILGSMASYPIIEGLGSPIVNFLHGWEEKKKAWVDKVMRGEIEPSATGAPAASDETAAADPLQKDVDDAITSIRGTKSTETKTPKRKAAAATGLVPTTTSKRNRSNIPGRFSGRYPLGSLPVYTQIQERAAELASGQPPSTNLDHGTRYLEFRVPNVSVPARLFNHYLASFVHALDRQQQQELASAAASSGSVIAFKPPRPPVLVRWADIQRYAFVEARDAAEACVMGEHCVARILHHPSGHFTFRRWRDPDRRLLKRTKEDPNMCYACILQFVNVIKDFDRSVGRPSGDVQSPFAYLIDVAGEYNRSAFRRCLTDGNNEGNARPVRHLVLTQLVPALSREPDGTTLRKFVENDELQYREGSRKISLLPLVSPQSSLRSEIVPLTNERILFLFIFRNMAGRYRASLGRELPEHLRVCRLAFAPFEDGVHMLANETFNMRYMPADFKDNGEYIVKHFDLFKLLNKLAPGTGSRSHPQFEGHMVYWLLHIRLNAALSLLHSGLDQLRTTLTSASSGRKSVAPASQPQAELDAAILPLSMRVGVQDTAGDPPAWVGLNTAGGSVQAEIQGIREKLLTFVRMHGKLTDYLKNAMESVDGRIDDEAILPDRPADPAAVTSGLWASIKPESSYAHVLGPLFPEDRRYIEYEERPHLVTKPSAGQLVYHYLQHWIVPSSASQAFTVGCLEDPTSPEPHSVTWAAEKSNPKAFTTLMFIFTQHPDAKKESVPLDISPKLFLGDFRQLVLWMQQKSTPEFRKRLYAACGKFEVYGWAYRRHEHAVRAIEDPRASWFAPDNAGYIILMCLLLVVHCSSLLMQSLQTLYHTRQKQSMSVLDGIHQRRTERVEAIMRARPENIYEYAPPATRPERAVLFRESMDTLQETIYQLQRHIHSFLPLAHVINRCLSITEAGPTDRELLVPRNALIHKPEMGSTMVDNAALSLYELYYPCGGARVMCEDNLVDCAPLESFVRFISEAANKEPLLDGQQKSMPVRCHTRDYEKKNEQLTFFNRAYSRYCIQNLFCSALGNYRHASVRPRFTRALEIYATLHNLSRLDLDHWNRFFVENKYIALNSLRENVAFHIRNNNSFHLAVEFSFDKYGAFENGWLRHCMDEFRRQLDLGAPIAAINASICSQFGTNTPFVYRRAKVDWYKYIGNRLCAVLCKRLVQKFMDQDAFVWPDVLMLSEKSVQYILQLVKELDANVETSEEFDYGQILEKLGCTADTVTLIRSVEVAFRTSPSKAVPIAAAAAAAVVDADDDADAEADDEEAGVISAASKNTNTALDLIPEEDHLIAFALFHFLRSRFSIRLLPLTEEETHAQHEAVARRMGLPPTAPLPVASSLIYFCSAAGCYKRKTSIVQERGVQTFGQADAWWDYTKRVPVCKPKKPPKSHSTGKGAKRKRPDSEAEASNEPAVVAPVESTVPVKQRTARLPPKSLAAAVREFTNKLKQIGDKYKKLIDNTREVDQAAAAAKALAEAVATNTTPNADAVLASAAQSDNVIATAGDVSKLKEWAGQLEKLRTEVHKAACAEANRFVRRMFDQPCESAALEPFPSIGFVVERNFIKEKSDVESYTRCPACGCPTVFRVDMFYSNGFTCSVCDAALRADLHKPCCIGCGRVCIIKESAAAAATRRRLAKAAARAAAIRQRKPKPTAAEQAETADEATATTPPPPAPKRRLKRRKVKAAMDKIAQQFYDFRPAANAEEDEVVRQKRGARASRRLGVDEWYSYNVINTELYRRESVPVCGACCYDRTAMLRVIEPYCTVQELAYLIKNNVSSMEDAKRYLNIFAPVSKRIAAGPASSSSSSSNAPPPKKKSKKLSAPNRILKRFRDAEANSNEANKKRK